MSYIESGKDAGATVQYGGERLGDKGYFIKPTIFTNVHADMKIVKEEIFGPVAVVIKFKDEAEVVEMANNTTYGLAASIFTQNVNRAVRVAHAVEAGTIWVSQPGFFTSSQLIMAFQVNCAQSFSLGVPGGGYKQSGIGRELGEYALDTFVFFSLGL